MPNPDRHRAARPTEQPSDELVLAAVERAARHRGKDTPDAPPWAIRAHLSIPKRSRAARRLNARLDALRAAGSLERSRRHGVAMWTLTSHGRRRLRRERLAGNVPELPESPQHSAWRSARTAAAQEIGRFRQSLSHQLSEAMGLLDMDPPARSDEWFELGQRLQRACWRLASASHCLHEWPEPDDARPDLDDHRDAGDEDLEDAARARRQARRIGRRNVRLWRERGGPFS